jgi:malonyl-CoA decarboxylase
MADIPAVGTTTDSPSNLPPARSLAPRGARKTATTAAALAAAPASSPAAAKPGAKACASRSAATPRRNAAQEKLLRHLLMDCRRLLSERGEANGPGIALAVVQQIEALNDELRGRFFEHLARDFSPDPKQVLAAALAYAHAPTDSAHLIRLTQAAEPPRQELFRRLNRAPGGTAAIVQLRRRLLERLPRCPTLAGVEHDLLHLLGSWFNPGFLLMRKVDWDSPARLLEQIIHHEAVHEIDGWEDLRRRLRPDRRCFAFFHPQLPDEPLIFVEVALVPEMAGAIAPLIDKKSQPLPPEQFKVAVFYSISNCQPGLRGVSMGNFLIKRVAEQLKRELPQLKTFCTLSPIPGLMGWLQKLSSPTRDAASMGSALAGLPQAATERAVHALALLREAAGADLHALAQAGTLAALPAAAHHALWRLAALYLVHHSPLPGGDPVARFHLDNGARLERLNAQANLAGKGLKQSAGLMVNYLYDLGRVETCHERFLRGRVVHSRALSALL